LAQLYAPEAAALAGLAVFLGHLFPLFHHFKGGKGVATAAGVLFGLDVWLGLGSLATWIVIAAFLRYASLASLVAALFAPFFAWYIGSSYDMLLRSEEHTSELQSLAYLVCRLVLEIKTSRML